MIINKLGLKFHVLVLLVVLVSLTSVVSAEDRKDVAREKLRRQVLFKNWRKQKMTNVEYYKEIDRPAALGCTKLLQRLKRDVRYYKVKSSKAKTVKTKKKYIAILKAYKAYFETLDLILVEFKKKRGGNVSTELYPILKKLERRITLYSGKPIKRDFLFTPEVYPSQFKPKETVTEDEETDSKTETKK